MTTRFNQFFSWPEWQITKISVIPIVLLFSITSCKSLSRKEHTTSDQVDKSNVVSDSNSSLNFTANRNFNRFGMASRHKNSKSKIKICFEDLIELWNPKAPTTFKEKTEIEQSVKRGLLAWWGDIPSNYLPEDHVLRGEEDFETHWQSNEKLCPGDINSYDLYVYAVEKIGGWEPDIPEIFPTAVGIYLHSFWKPAGLHPGLYIKHREHPRIDGKINITLQGTVTHELGHYLGLDEAYTPGTNGSAPEKREDGLYLCRFRFPGAPTTMGYQEKEREPDSVMCNAGDGTLTPHDKETAICMYCNAWPSADMPASHPCMKALGSNKCIDFSK